VLQGYSLPNLPTENEILARSEYLKSLGIDPYKEVHPKFIRTQFNPSRIILFYKYSKLIILLLPTKTRNARPHSATEMAIAD
jgi:hypothetical protein